MSGQNKNSSFAEKSDYQKKLIKFTHDVNTHSDSLRRAYIEQAQDKDKMPILPEDTPASPSESAASAYAL